MPLRRAARLAGALGRDRRALRDPRVLLVRAPRRRRGGGLPRSARAPAQRRGDRRALPGDGGERLRRVGLPGAGAGRLVARPLVALRAAGRRRARRRARWRTLARRELEAAFWVAAAASFAPVSQVFPFLNPVADRYLYCILPGLIGGALCWGRERALRRAPRAALAARGARRRGGRRGALARGLRACGRRRAPRSGRARRACCSTPRATIRRAARRTTCARAARRSAATSTRRSRRCASPAQRGIDRFTVLERDPGLAPIRGEPGVPRAGARAGAALDRAGAPARLRARSPSCACSAWRTSRAASSSRRWRPSRARSRRADRWTRSCARELEEARARLARDARAAEVRVARRPR